jgi:hypothetical protein
MRAKKAMFSGPSAACLSWGTYKRLYHLPHLSLLHICTETSTAFIICNKFTIIFSLFPAELHALMMSQLKKRRQQHCFFKYTLENMMRPTIPPWVA